MPTDNDAVGVCVALSVAVPVADEEPVALATALPLLAALTLAVNGALAVSCAVVVAWAERTGECVFAEERVRGALGDASPLADATALLDAVTVWSAEVEVMDERDGRAEGEATCVWDASDVAELPDDCDDVETAEGECRALPDDCGD